MTPNEIARSLGLEIPEGFSADANVSEEFRGALQIMLGLYQAAGEALQDEFNLRSVEVMTCMATALGCVSGSLLGQSGIPVDDAEAQIERLAQSIRLNALAHYRIAALGAVPAAGSA